MAFGDLTRARVRMGVGQALAEVEATAERAERSMKQNHPWTNQTGAAEESLYARVRHRRGRGAVRATIELGYDDAVLARANPDEYGRVGNYGQFLETMQGGTFAVVQPTADAIRLGLGRRAFNRLARAMGGF